MKFSHIFCLAVIITLIAGGIVSAQENSGAREQTSPGNIVIPHTVPEVNAANSTGAADDRAGLVPVIRSADSSLPSEDASSNLITGRYLYLKLSQRINNGTTPAVVSRVPGKFELFYFDGQNVNTTTKGMGNLSWDGPETVLDILSKVYSPAAFSENASHVGVFYVGAGTHGIYTMEWNGAWSGLEPRFSNEVYSTPGAVSRKQGNVELVYLNASDYLIHRTRTDGNWSAGEVIANPTAIRYGASIISAASDSFDIYANAASNHHVWTRHWSETGGWEDWKDTGIASYSFVSASVRNYDDGTTRFNRIDLVTNATTVSDGFHWTVSYDGGSSWKSEPYTNDGNLYLGTNDAIPAIYSTHYNRVETFGGYDTYIYDLIWRAPTLSQIGIFSNGNWYLDSNGNGVYNVGVDKTCGFGTTGWTPVTGDWDGNGVSDIGVYRAGAWYLDLNGDGVFGEGDMNFAFGTTGWTPVIGDFNRDGKDEVAIYRWGSWYIDYTGDGKWGTGDENFGFGDVNWTPIAGQWKYDSDSSLSSKDKIGVYKEGAWYLDMDGKGKWSEGDMNFAFGAPGWTPVLGDWTGDGTTKVGVYKDGGWYLDMDGDGTWDAGDKVYTFGSAGYEPVVGDWTADGKTEIGVSNGGSWYLDSNGDGTFNAGDKSYGFGAAGWTPVTGGWI